MDSIFQEDAPVAHPKMASLITISSDVGLFKRCLKHDATPLC